MIEYLDEIETELQMIFACSSGAKMGSNYGKIVVENLVTRAL